MKVCDVVLNSVWNDPRVTKQVAEYLKAGIEVVCVGMKYKAFDQAKVDAMPCPVIILERDVQYAGKQKSILKKLLREKYRNDSVVEAIVAQKPDVIHANDLDALIPSYLASRKLGCRLIYDSHEICCENRMYNKFWLYNQFMKRVERHIVKRVDRMICVSHAAAEYFADLYQIEKPMVVTNCIRQQDVVEQTAEKHAGFEVLNHGILHDSRGLEWMADSCAALRDHTGIRMASRGYGGIEKELRKRVEDEQLDNFLMYPPVEPKELIPEAARSHVGVAVTLPVCLNFLLSVSNRLFEYAAAGLPVIMSDIPEHRYLNDKYQFGIVVENNRQEAFVQAVLRLYTDKAFYAQCSENAVRMTREIVWENQFAPVIEYVQSIGHIRNEE